MSLDRLLRPRSIAVLGAGWAANVIEQCRRMGFAGPVWPVHPTRDQIAGVPCLPSLAALPQAPDATFIGVNRHATVEVVAELSAMGAGGAVCFAAGWKEAGEGDLQQALVAAAGAMPILGPNCYGIINYLDGALLWPDQHGGRRVGRGVALIAQSSNIAVNLTMQRRGLPLAYVACLGNAAQTGLAALGAALLADDRVTALGIHAEGFDDAPGLAALAEAARAAGKGIVALKSGKSEAGASAAASHTASLSGGGIASSAFLAQAGIAEVATLSDLLETLKILHVHGPLTARNVASVSCSGGEAGLMADLAENGPLAFPPPSADLAARLSATLGPLVAIANPLDYHTFIWGDEERTAEVFSAMAEAHDATFFVIDPPRDDRCDPSSYDPALRAIETAARTTGRPCFPLASIPENFGEDRAAALIDRGIAPLMGLETGLAALAAAATPPGRPGWRPLPPAPPRPTRLLDEGAAKARLAAAGIAVPRGASAPSLAALDTSGLTPPLALKGTGLLHKTEAGAVRLNLHTLDGQAEMPGVTGYLVEEMVTGTTAELLLGVARHPVYGATLTLGMGGTEAELLADTVTLICPATRDEIAAALRRLRLWPLLDGYRGRPRAAVAAAIDAALALQSLLDDPAVEEAEINPLLLTETRATAVDAVIREALP